jgi:hypothetical protein
MRRRIPACDFRLWTLDFGLELEKRMNTKKRKGIRMQREWVSETLKNE